MNRPSPAGLQAVNSSSRLLELDALRGFAALAVLLFHYTVHYSGAEGLGHADPIYVSFPLGFHGVTLFFMISGFVILMTLDRTKTVIDFAVARFTRLYPAYWAAVLFTFVLTNAVCLPNRCHGWKVFLINLTMLQDFVNAPRIDGVYWSLASELCFYVLVALIVGLGLRARLSSNLLLLIAAGIAFRWFYPDLHGNVFSLADKTLVQYLHLFLIGIVCYEMRSGWRWKHALILLACLLAAVFRYERQDLVVVVVLATVMLVATQFPVRLLRNRVLVYLGTISYSLYLIHQYFGYIVIRAGYAHGLNGNVSIVLALAAAIGVASLLTFLIERPAHDYLRRAYKRWRYPPPASVFAGAVAVAPAVTDTDDGAAAMISER